MSPRTQMTRREFIKVSFTAGGSLVVGAYLAACAPNPPAPAPTATTVATNVPTLAATALPTATAQPTETPPPTPTVEPAAPFQADLLIQIDPDGIITLTVYRSEMGQGVRTALAMLLADELDADWSKVRVVQAPANPNIGNNQITGGSGSIADTFTPLRKAGARARAIMVAAAAQTWGVKPGDCRTEPSTVIHTASGKQLAYGELVTAAKTVELQGVPRPKDPKDFRLIGKSIPRLDEPQIVAGKAKYGLDMRVPNMLYATVARCPVPGGTLAQFDATRAQAVPGVRKVVKIPTGVAVVADNTWAAMQGRKALQVTWNEGANAALASDSIHKQMLDQLKQNVDDAAPGVLKTLDAFYETPYLAHAAMEPLNCVADVRSDHCDIWTSTQNPQEVQSFVRDAIGVPTDVHVPLLGGGFGRRLEVDFAVEAAQVSRAAAAPVQVVWTREDDMQHDFYRQPTVHWLRAGWDDKNVISLWRHIITGPGLNGIAYKVGSDVLEEGLEVPYSIDDIKSQAVLADVPLPTGPWRAVMAGTNSFANECFLDEVAAALHQDPYAFRMSLLPQGARLRGVLALAATQAKWDTPPDPGHARGIAAHTYHDTAVAMVADVSVNNGALRVHKIVCAIDCGIVVHPDMVAQQMEGGIAFALTALRNGEITWKQGRVQQSNFNDYPLLQMSEIPQVEVNIVPSIRAPSGAGEMGVPPLTPAVLNAVFALTGKRIRHAPLRAGDLKA